MDERSRIGCKRSRSDIDCANNIKMDKHITNNQIPKIGFNLIYTVPLTVPCKIKKAMIVNAIKAFTFYKYSGLEFT